MIQQISKLKNFGIFQDYKPSKDLKPFTQYNLFYGWNGSGKSTVAKLFFSLADKKNHSHFENGEFTVQVKDQSDVSHKNISTNALNIAKSDCRDQVIPETSLQPFPIQIDHSKPDETDLSSTRCIFPFSSN